MTRYPLTCLLLAGLLAGCAEPEQVRRLVEPDIARTKADGPPNSAPGTCWGRETSPAVIETITETQLVKSAAYDADGAVLNEAEFEIETSQRIVEDRQEIWFETPCPDQMTPEFTTSLQRALEARGVYHGAITGEMDATTRAAVRAYQSESGLHSEILSLAASRKLGLLPYEVERVPG